MARIEQVAQIVLPRREPGYDFGAESRVLVEDRRVSPPVRLVWRGPFARSYHGSPDYYPGELRLDRSENKPWLRVGPCRSNRTLHKGGRLSAKLVRRYEHEIDAVFGVDGLSRLVKPGITLTIEE